MDLTDDMRERLAVAARNIRENHWPDEVAAPEPEPVSRSRHPGPGRFKTWDAYWGWLDKTLMRSYNTLGSAYAVSKTTGVPYSTVNRRLRRLGVELTPVSKRRKSYSQTDLVAAWSRFQTIRKTTLAVNGCFETVRRELIRLGLHQPK